MAASSTFAPSRNPDVGLDMVVRFTAYEATFGDGYTARAPKGINNEEVEVSLTWNRISLAEADAIENFFRSMRGTVPFWYTLPFTNNTRQFICKTYTRTRVTGLLDTIKATFTKVNDL